MIRRWRGCGWRRLQIGVVSKFSLVAQQSHIPVFIQVSTERHTFCSNLSQDVRDIANAESFGFMHVKRSPSIPDVVKRNCIIKIPYEFGFFVSAL